MSTPSNGQFQDLDVCGNLVTQNIRSMNGSTLGNHSNAFNLVNGFFLSNASVNQFSQGATYGNNSVFQKRVTIRDLTLQENFVAQGDAVYQGNFQAEQDLNAIGNNVSIGKSVDNQTRLFIKTTQPGTSGGFIPTKKTKKTTPVTGTTKPGTGGGGGGFTPTTTAQNIARTTSRVEDGRVKAYGLAKGGIARMLGE